MWLGQPAASFEPASLVAQCCIITRGHRTHDNLGLPGQSPLNHSLCGGYFTRRVGSFAITPLALVLKHLKCSVSRAFGRAA